MAHEHGGHEHSGHEHSGHEHSGHEHSGHEHPQDAAGTAPRLDPVCGMTVEAPDAPRLERDGVEIFF